jgi:hypothetical protein
MANRILTLADPEREVWVLLLNNNRNLNLLYQIPLTQSSEIYLSITKV